MLVSIKIVCVLNIFLLTIGGGLSATTVGDIDDEFNVDGYLVR
jgi:hypothetical protein